MGKPMARNLMRVGNKLAVYDISPAGVAELVAAGAAGGLLLQLLARAEREGID